ncbi:calmodulin regulated spectrin associated protein family member 3 [Rhinolophus ferrumequinum]|uniref:Calmodulin regulated spectrin associated protein family member 3 n=1 Tax=Rhinolophus ferrumequinum TaxID=59479 RepID=A0A7J7TZ97_RHIFE|nr:calmodulin regulated spectrin associated protein family member 3 [Rhinolophus ferrumequinum]
MVEAAPPGPGPLRRTFLVPEIKSLDQYDFSRAKAAASLAWVLRAAFGGAEHVPSELWEPFYTDQYAQEHVKPPVTRLLLSAELYCRAWRQALPQLETPPSPSALLALLARRGTVPALPERPVQEADLRHQPILMGAHLAVIDALMVAFAFEWTKTLPGPLALASLEHKLLFWVDTTIRRLQEKTEQEAAQRASPSASADGVAPTQPSCPTRWYWKLVPIRYRKDRALARRAPCFPTVTSLQDLASGAALAATIHCYCPQLLRLEEVCLKDPMSVADSLYNLQLVQDFCASRLPRGCPLSLEDLLYVPPPLKVNLVVLLAEMFMCFEVLKPDFVQAKDLPDGHAASPRATDASTPQNSSGSSSPVFNFRHPLLSPGGPQSPLRGSTGSLKSSPSMSHMEVLGKAWNRQLSQVPVQTRSSILLSEGPPPEEPSARPGLIEIPLGSLEEPSAEDEGDGSPPGAEDSLEEEASSEGEPRGGLGFFYKDEDKPEDEMAQKRASLLERQQRRVEEARRRKQWQEAEKEQRREEAVRLAQEEVVPSPPAPTATSVPAARAPAEEEVGTRRGEFTRLEYERRAQLKLMDDLDKVLRPRGAGGPGRGGRRAPRPRSGCCDDSALARSPARGLLGSRLSKVYSQSTLSLSTVANEANNLGVKRPSRAPSPSGLMSPSRLPGNRDRDWENGSNASSPASVPEYTGPRLYKEPSAKSNKFIIHNALSHCCLAGRVNEPQKNRILEEIEKSKANHFLILFRDSSCQFRALYTLSGETEELSRLAGYGPRTVTPAMVEGIYKYNSDRKRFTQIPAKTMSMSVDAFTIQGHLWQSKKPTTPKKGGSTPK